MEMINAIHPGDTVRVSLPKDIQGEIQLPFVFQNWDPNWQEWVKSHDGKLCKVRRTKLIAGKSGWYLDATPAGWVPAPWLIKTKCDCPLNLLLSRGCQIGSHY